MNTVAKKIVSSIAAFVICFVVVKYGVQEFRLRRAVSSEEALVREAPLKHPDLPPSVAIEQEEEKYVAEKLASDSSETEKQNVAANAFGGFYFSNTRDRYEFCKEHGVDISALVAAFERVHVSEYAKAKAVYLRSGSSEETTYAAIKASHPEGISQAMKDWSTTLKRSLPEVCKALADHAEALATE